MAIYRKIDTRIWNDAKFNALSPNGKLAFLFILTNPNMTALGAMRATIEGLSAELRIPAEAFREVFGEPNPPSQDREVSTTESVHGRPSAQKIGNGGGV